MSAFKIFLFILQKDRKVDFKLENLKVMEFMLML